MVFDVRLGTTSDMSNPSRPLSPQQVTKTDIPVTSKVTQSQNNDAIFRKSNDFNKTTPLNIESGDV